MTIVTDRRAIVSYSWVGSDSAGQPLVDRPVFISYSFETSTTALGLGGRFNGESQAYIDSFRPLSAAQQATARGAFQAWDAASGITFLEVPAGYGDIKVGIFNFDLGGPYTSAEAAAYAGGDELIVSDKISQPSTQLFLHEIGHNLGFKHPFEGTYTLDPAIDNYATTVLSYTSGGFSGSTLGTLDLDAVSYLYGTASEDGQQVQSWSWNASTSTLSQTGFDAGGKIRGVGGNNDIRSGPGADDITLNAGGTNVVDSGAGKDTINVSGYGLPGGSVSISSGEGDDQIYLPMTGRFAINGGTGTDSVQFVAAYNIATTFSLVAALASGNSLSNVESISITGSNLGDSLTGGASNDFLNGNGGRDRLFGGEGNDQLYINISGDLTGYSIDGGSGDDLAVLTFTDNTPRTLTTSQLGATAIENTYVYLGDGNDIVSADSTNTAAYFYGRAGSDVLRAGAARTDLNGGEGADVLFAGTGFSFLYGGNGADRFVFESVATSNNVNGTDQIEDFQTGVDVIDLTAFRATSVTITPNGGGASFIDATAASGTFRLFVRNPVTLADIAYKVVTGTENGETLTGSADRDTILALGGGDVLIGGSAPDTLTGGAGVDIFQGTPAELNGDSITDLAIGERIRFIGAGAAGSPAFTYALSGNTLTFTGGSLTLGSLPPQSTRMRAFTNALDGNVDVWLQSVRNDFNGDGRSDVLWRNDNGFLSQWLGTASGGFTDNGTLVNQFVPSAWKIQDAADFNGDGFADVLWRNDNGQLSQWLGSATGRLIDNGAVVNQFVPNAWKIQGTGDFNGDGRADIMWRNDSGQLSEWIGTANGDFIDNGAVVNQFVPNAWAIHIEDYQAI